MNEPERYELVYNPATNQPIGVTDLWHPGAMSVQDMPPQTSPYPVREPVYQPIPLQMPVNTYRSAQLRLPSGAAVRLCLYAVLAIFAAGVAAGCWLFGSREEQVSTVVVCPAAGMQVAVLPAECGSPAGGELR